MDTLSDGAKYENSPRAAQMNRLGAFLSGVLLGFGLGVLLTLLYCIVRFGK
jgi:hypothetical protein